MVMQSDWAERQKAREEMNKAYGRWQQGDARFRTIKQQCYGFRDYNNYRINVLQHEAKYADASRRKSIETEIEGLLKEIYSINAETKKRLTRDYKKEYGQAMHTFNKARNRHEDSTMEYEYYKAIRDNYKAEYDKAKAEYDKKENQPPK